MQNVTLPSPHPLLLPVSELYTPVRHSPSHNPILAKFCGRIESSLNASANDMVVRLGSQLHYPPYAFRCQYDRPMCKRPGSAVEVTELIMRMLGLSFIFKPARDYGWGSFSENHGWDGLVKDLLENELDITLPFMRPSNKRVEVTDASMPLIRRGMDAFLMNRKLTDGPPRDMLSTEVTICLCLVGLTGLLKAFLPWIRCTCCVQRCKNRNALAAAKSSTLFRGNWLLRVQGLVLVAAFGALVSSDFVGEFAVQTFKPPFMAIDDPKLPEMLASRQIQWMTKSRSFAVILDIETLPKFAKIKEALKKQPLLVVSDPDAWLRIVNERPDLITYQDADSMRYRLSQHGTLANFDLVYNPKSLRYGSCMLARKGWPYLRAVNHAILLLEEAGLIQKVLRVYTSSLERYDRMQADHKKQGGKGLSKRAVAIQHIKFLGYLFFGALGLSSIAFVAELFHFYKLRRDSSPAF